jgi:hypothetical protein
MKPRWIAVEGAFLRVEQIVCIKRSGRRVFVEDTNNEAYLHSECADEESAIETMKKIADMI